jgi:hypothetical protein
MLQQLPDVVIELDRPRKLRYDFAAFAAIQRESGGRIKLQGPHAEEGWRALLIDQGPEESLLLIWAGLLWQHRKGGEFAGEKPLTPEDVGSYFTVRTFEPIRAQVSVALRAAMPEMEDDAENPPAPMPQSQTGANSGPSDESISG